MTSWHENTFQITGTFWGESTDVVKKPVEIQFDWRYNISLLKPEYYRIAMAILWLQLPCLHYDDVRIGAIASQITSLTIVYSIVYSDVDQRKHQSSVSLAFVHGIQRGPVNSPHKWPVTRKMFPFDDVIMSLHHVVLINDGIDYRIITNHHLPGRIVSTTCTISVLRYDRK